MFPDPYSLLIKGHYAQGPSTDFKIIRHVSIFPQNIIQRARISKTRFRAQIESG